MKSQSLKMTLRHTLMMTSSFVALSTRRGAVAKRRPEIAFGYFKAAAENSTQAALNLGQCYYGARAKAVLARPAFVIESR